MASENMFSSTPPKDPDSLVPAVLGAIGLSLFLWLIVSTVQTWYRLRHIPGPRIAGWSSWWMVRVLAKAKADEYYLGLKKYGPLVRVGPNYLVTEDLDTLRRMGAVRGEWTRDKWFELGRFDGHDSMISLLDTARHDAVKAKTAGTYSGRESANFEEAVDSQIEHLVRILRDKYEVAIGSSQVRHVDLATLGKNFTLDVITKLGYGEPMGFMDAADGDLHGFNSGVEKLFGLSGMIAESPLLSTVWKTRLGQWLFAEKQTDKDGFGKVMGVNMGIVADRFREWRGQDAEKQTFGKDMLGGFMRNGLSEQECKSEVMLMVVAGSDTASSAMRYTLFHLMTTPRVYQKLKEEIREAILQGRASHPITNAQSRALPYLQAVIWEGFRIHPPVIYSHFKQVPPQGDTICGHFVPPGTAVGHNLVALCHNTDIFGPDVGLFRPERFLACTPAQRQTMDRALNAVFGQGRWQCAGMLLANTELNKIYFELLRNFDLQLVEPERPWTKRSYMVSMNRDMRALVTASNLRHL